MKYKPRVIGRPSSSSCNLTIFSQTCSAMERRSDSLENYNKGQQNLVTEGSGPFADYVGLQQSPPKLDIHKRLTSFSSCSFGAQILCLFSLNWRIFFHPISPYVASWLPQDNPIRLVL